MKKLVSLTLTMAMILSAVSCSSKNNGDSSDAPAPAPAQSVEVTQLKYKQEDISLPEDISYRIDLYYHDGVRLIYETKEKQIKVMCYDEEMNEASSFEIFDHSNDFDLINCCTKPDGSIALLITKAEYDKEEITDYEDYYNNAKVSFEILTYSPDGEQLGTLELTGLDGFNLMNFVAGFAPYGEKYIISFNNDLALIDENGEATEVKNNTESYTYGVDTEGRTIAGTWENYNYLDGETLDYDTDNAIEYGKWDKLMGGIFTGTGAFKAYFVTNNGISGLTYSDELVQVLDFSDSNINANGIRYACYGGEGKFIIMGDDQTTSSGIFYKLLTVRPDDYVENKQTVILGCNQNDRNAQEIATMYNNQSDSYKVELKKYSDDDDLKLDVLSGSAPDLYCYGESATMYRYANLGAFADLYELMEQNDGIKTDNIAENVLQAFEYKGGLYGVPIAFSISPYVANREVIGREYSYWNYDEFFSFAENLPEGMYLGSKNSPFAYREIMFDRLCANSLNSWIDYNNYTCNFDSDEFIHLLNFCMNAEINEPYDWGGVISTTNEDQMVEYNEAEMSVKNKTSLLYDAQYFHSSYDFMDIPLRIGLFLDNNYTYVIAPSNDRRGTIETVNKMCYSILNNAACPDGAWDFFNYIMNPKFQNSYMQVERALTSNKESLEYKMDKAMKESENYQITKDDPTLFLNASYGGGWADGIEWFTQPITEEDMAYFNEFLSSCNKLKDSDSDVYTIIQEEYTAFINGETTAQECAAMIQNRVSIYLSENA